MAARAEVIDRDLGWKDIQKQIKAMDDMSTNVGLFGSGGSPSDDMAERAAVMEFGTRNGNIPERPFMRQAFNRHLKSLEKVVATFYGRVLDRKITTINALKTIGEWYTDKVKDTILNGSFDALKPATIAAKGSSKPLIDTADMKNRVEHKERKG